MNIPQTAGAVESATTLNLADEEAATSGPMFDPLVPVRLDFHAEGKHTTEIFTWNTLESTMTPKDFSLILAADLGLGNDVVEEMATSIQEQIDAFVPPKRRRLDSGESRQVVRLNLRMGRVVLRDQFEWDLNSTENCPESFASHLCIEMGLGTEYAPAIAHAVREQLNNLAEFEDKRARRAVVNVRNALRGPGEAGQWEPRVECLSVEDQQRLERKEKREARLQRRNRGKADVFGKTRIRYHDPSLARRRTPATNESNSEQDNTGRKAENRRRRR